MLHLKARTCQKAGKRGTGLGPQKLCCFWETRPSLNLLYLGSYFRAQICSPLICSASHICFFSNFEISFSDKIRNFSKSSMCTLFSYYLVSLYIKRNDFFYFFFSQRWWKIKLTLCPHLILTKVWGRFFLFYIVYDKWKVVHHPDMSDSWIQLPSHVWKCLEIWKPLRKKKKKKLVKKFIFPYNLNKKSLSVSRKKSYVSLKYLRSSTFSIDKYIYNTPVK